MRTKQRFSIVFGAISIAFCGAAKADNWGCEVLLCLSNPAGPMAVAQCVPPIKRLYRAIFKTRPDPFPTCTMAASPDGSRSYANVSYNDYYDPCPSGTSALPSGAYAVQGTPEQMAAHSSLGWWRQANGPFANAQIGAGIGEGAGIMPSWEQPLNVKVCVGNQLGTVNLTRQSSWDDYQNYSVGVYDRVAFINPSANGFAIKVYMNNALYRVVRPEL